MGIEWVKINNFADIIFFNPEFPLDRTQWLDKTILSGDFEPKTTVFISSYLSTHDDCVCVDVGANLGYYTTMMAYLGKKVYAFEPATKYFKRLSECCKRNSLDEKCVLFKNAVSNKRQDMKLPVYLQSATFHEPGNYTPEIIETVKSVTLDDTIKEKVDIIKIDCDGHDPFVVYGAEKILHEYKPVMVIEVAWSHYRKAGINIEEFYNYLNSIGYVVFSENDVNKPMSLKDLLAFEGSGGISSFNIVCFHK